VNACEREITTDFGALYESSPSSFHALLSNKPSQSVLDRLWDDFLSSSHPKRHFRADKAADEGRLSGRGCFCPLWEAQQRMSFSRMLEVSQEGDERVGGIGVEELGAVVEVVFGGTTSYFAELSTRLGVTPLSMRDLLEQIHELNWFWFERTFSLPSPSSLPFADSPPLLLAEIFELASTRLIYSQLHRSVNPIVADALAEHISLREEVVAAEKEELEKVQKVQDGLMKSGRMDHEVAHETHVSLMLLTAEWEKQCVFSFPSFFPLFLSSLSPASFRLPSLASPHLFPLPNSSCFSSCFPTDIPPTVSSIRRKPELEALLTRLGGPPPDPQIQTWIEHQPEPGAGGYHWRNWK
jgi:hypothetical protein